MTTNHVLVSCDVSRRRAWIGQHERVITSGVDDVIVSWYQVDVTCCDVEAYSGAAIPRKVHHLLQIRYVIGGLEMIDVSISGAPISQVISG